MGYDITLENSNTANLICKPYLSVASFSQPTYDIIKLVSVEDGYIKKDKIIKLQLDDSYIDTSNLYPFNKNTEYFFNKDSKESSFYISNIAELSGNTTISIYGKEKELSNFFGTLTANTTLENTYINYSAILQFAEDEVEIAPEFDIKNITNTSAKIYVYENPTQITNVIIRYSLYNEDDWMVIEGNELEVLISDLESKQLYEVQITVYYLYNNIPLYSNSKLFKTI